jgi:2'-5' RNA ligase
MRLFAALDPPPPAVTSLQDAVSELPSLPALRIVPAEQWHLTLAFYGKVPDGRVDEVRERLGRAAARAEPLSLRLTGAGTFGRQARRAHVLWAGLSGDVEQARRLAERCSAAGRRAGVVMEDRPFRPHLTIGRVRGRQADLRDAVAVLSPYAGPTWTAAELRLVRSHLGPPTTHETLTTWALGPGR